MIRLAGRSIWGMICLSGISLLKIQCVNGNSMPFHLGEIKVFKSDLAIQITAMIRIFRRDRDSIDVGTKSDRLVLLAYVGWGSFCNQTLA
jgi:hypothetical protein